MTSATTQQRIYYSETAIARLVDIIVGLIEIALGLRLILKLIGANPAAGFVAWVYDITAPLLQPFAGMLPSPALEGGLILEFSTLFAMLIYALLGWLIIELVRFISNATRAGTA